MLNKEAKVQGIDCYAEFRKPGVSNNCIVSPGLHNNRRTYAYELSS